MQQKIGLLKIAHLDSANEMVAELKCLIPAIRYCRPMLIENILITPLSDASHGCENEIYVQIVILTGIKIMCEGLVEDVYHIIGVNSRKQRRVSYPSLESEILAASNGDDRGYDIKMAFASILPQLPLRHEL